jgi:hypothetical protein
VLKIFKMANVNPVPTPVALGLKVSKNDKSPSLDATLFKRLVGRLMYLTATRPYIMYGVSLISRFMDKPKESHWKAGKRALKFCMHLQIITNLLDIRIVTGEEAWMIEKALRGISFI